MKKVILILTATLFPSLIFAQVPNLYDEWAPAIFGSKAHFVISNNEIVVTFPRDAEQVTAMLAPAMPSPMSPQIEAKSDPAAARTERVKLLKVVFDSAQAKGRFFIQVETKYDTTILPVRFVLKDNGEMGIGFAESPYELFLNGKKTLKQIVKETTPGAKKIQKKHKGNNFDFNFFNALSDFSFTFYNKARTVEFAKLKDPAQMPKEELIGMMNSFGDRIAAEFQNQPQNTSAASADELGELSEVNAVVPMFKVGLRIVHELFIAHGYNPLAVSSVISKFDHDSDIKVAGENLGDKIEESVPVLREQKLKREAKKIENIKSQISDINDNLKERSDLISKFIEETKGSENINRQTIDNLSTARTKVSELILTEEIAKDSASLAKFETLQNECSAAVFESIKMLEENQDLKSQENITSLLSELEGKENRIRIEIRNYNDLLKYKYSTPKNVHYYTFTGKEYEFPDPAPAPPIPQPAPPPPPAPDEKK